MERIGGEGEGMEVEGRVVWGRGKDPLVLAYIPLYEILDKTLWVSINLLHCKCVSYGCWAQNEELVQRCQQHECHNDPSAECLDVEHPDVRAVHIS